MSESSDVILEKQIEALSGMLINMVKQGNERQVLPSLRENLDILFSQIRIEAQMDMLREFTSFGEKDGRAFRAKGWVQFLHEQADKVSKRLKKEPFLST